ncbi:MAG TPA: LysR substrate-binding domain-containing protein [Burkholderiaceae bacterium]|jgi:LysR family tcuABC transcriptional regulator
MELRQLRYLVRVVELGSMGRAAAEFGMVTSTLSQQISRLESELSTRLLQRTKTGTAPTAAGLAFVRQAQLVLRHAANAVQAAQHARLTGHVSVGMAPSTAASLGVPFLQAMRARYPDVRLHLVEALSGHLAAMLDARQLDIAMVFHAGASRSWNVSPLLAERLFAIGGDAVPGMPHGPQTTLAALVELPLVLPTASHGLRALIDAAFARNGREPNIVLEVDGLALLMDAVRAGVGATLQPGAAFGRETGGALRRSEITDASMVRPTLLASIPEDELSPAGLAARTVLLDVGRRLVRDGAWPGASLHED